MRQNLIMMLWCGLMPRWKNSNSMELIFNKMSRFGKETLCYNYRWDNADDEGSILKKRTLDRANGLEMLYFIIDFFQSHNLTSHASFVRAEYLLYNHLPINIKNKSEIISWLLKHWDSEFYRR